MGKAKKKPETKPEKKAPKKKPKSNDAQVAVRVEEVLRIRLDGAQIHDVREYASEKKWGVTDRQLQEYVNRADQLLVDRQEKSRKKIIARRLAQREALYARAVNAADLRTALAVLDSADKMRGLFASDSELKQLLKLATEQAARLNELEAQVASTQRTPGTAQTPAPPTGPTDGAT